MHRDTCVRPLKAVSDLWRPRDHPGGERCDGHLSRVGDIAAHHLDNAACRHRRSADETFGANRNEQGDMNMDGKIY